MGAGALGEAVTGWEGWLGSLGSEHPVGLFQEKLKKKKTNPKTRVRAQLASCSLFQLCFL